MWHAALRNLSWTGKADWLKLTRCCVLVGIIGCVSGLSTVTSYQEFFVPAAGGDVGRPGQLVSRLPAKTAWPGQHQETEFQGSSPTLGT